MSSTILILPKTPRNFFRFCLVYCYRKLRIDYVFCDYEIKIIKKFFKNHPHNGLCRGLINYAERIGIQTNHLILKFDYHECTIVEKAIRDECSEKKKRLTKYLGWVVSSIFSAVMLFLLK